jgi:Domain of unknown function (DUF4411)
MTENRDAEEQCYCIDAAAIVELGLTYPRANFGRLWRHLERLIAVGRLMVPREVIEELEERDSTLATWARSRAHFVKPWTADLVDKACQVIAAVPDIVDADAEDQDSRAFVVALARVNTEQPALFPRRCSVVTTAPRLIGGGAVARACHLFRIDCIDIRQLIALEEWQL